MSPAGISFQPGYGVSRQEIIYNRITHLRVVFLRFSFIQRLDKSP